MAEITILIDGMSCMHCVGRVKKALDSIPGITSSNVEVGKAVVSFDETKTSKDAIEAAIKKAGYKIRT